MLQRRPHGASYPSLPDAEPPDVVSMAVQVLFPQLRPWRLGATLFSAFGLLALIVAGIGIYSIISYSVGQRTHELGVRVTLGAQRRDLLALVLTEGLRTVAGGVVLGVVLAIAMGHVIASMLYATSPRDPVVMVAVALTLLVAACAASLVPAVTGQRASTRWRRCGKSRLSAEHADRSRNGPGRDKRRTWLDGHITHQVYT